MSKYDVVIIGSGMGGLACGAMLSKEGMRVCVVEKGAVLGGCLQSFTRRGHLLDTGIHYAGSLYEGQVLNQYFKYFEVLPQLQLRKLDSEGFDVIHLDGQAYRHAIGLDHFADTLSHDFPHERAGINNYCGLLKKIGEFIHPDVLRQGRLSAGGADYLGVSAAASIDALVSDPTLRRVLAGNALLYAGQRDRSPLYHHAMINYSNIEGACCFEAGTQHIADAFAATIRRQGGELRTLSEVTCLRIDGTHIRGVEINGGVELLEAKYVISDASPAVTFNLLEPTPLLKRAFMSRLNYLPNTYGVFTLHVILKSGALPYENRNHYFYHSADVWSAECDFEGCNIPMALLCMQPPLKGDYAEVVNLLVPMPYHYVARWANTPSGRRGVDYELFKARYAEAALRFVERQKPGFRGAIEHLYTSTPLTYCDYTSVPEGAAYGLQKDFNHPMTSLIPARSKIGNLLLTGQNLNVHGMLGVTISAAMTCGELLGEEYLAKKIGYA